MSDNIKHQQAMILFERAYKQQMRGEFGEAIMLYKRSITTLPTAEAYTFLGWTYSMMERYEEAIEACEEAIKIDPTFGNAYNDIVAYLIEQDKWDEATPWLEKALEAPNYDVRHFACLNLGRVQQHFGHFAKALDLYNRAIALDPFYRSAVWAKYQLLGRLN